MLVRSGNLQPGLYKSVALSTPIEPLSFMLGSVNSCKNNDSQDRRATGKGAWPQPSRGAARRIPEGPKVQGFMTLRYRTEEERRSYSTSYHVRCSLHGVSPWRRRALPYLLPQYQVPMLTLPPIGSRRQMPPEGYHCKCHGHCHVAGQGIIQALLSPLCLN